MKQTELEITIAGQGEGSLEHPKTRGTELHNKHFLIGWSLYLLKFISLDAKEETIHHTKSHTSNR